MCIGFKKGYATPLFKFLFSLLEKSRIISIVGGGGKTSLMILLKDIFLSEGFSVMLTTTTHLSARINYGVNQIFSDDNFRQSSILPRSLLFANLDVNNDKFFCPEKNNIKYLAGYYDKVIIEADGSRGLPLKYHNNSEPVLVDFTDTCISLHGLDSIGFAIKNCMHRYDGFCQEFNVGDETIVDSQQIYNLTRSSKGSFCNVDTNMKRILFFNKVDFFVNDRKMMEKLFDLSSQTGGYLISICKNYLISSRGI